MKKLIAVLLCLAVLAGCASSLAASMYFVGTGEAKLTEESIARNARSYGEKEWYYDMNIAPPPTVVYAATVNDRVNLSWPEVTHATEYRVYEQYGTRWEYLDTVDYPMYRISLEDGVHRLGVTTVRVMGHNYYESDYVRYVDVLVLDGEDTPDRWDYVEPVDLSGTMDQTVYLDLPFDSFLHIRTDDLTWLESNGAIITPDAHNEVYFTDLGNDLYIKPEKYTDAYSSKAIIRVTTYNAIPVEKSGRIYYMAGEERATFTLRISFSKNEQTLSLHKENQRVSASVIARRAVKLTDVITFNTPPVGTVTFSKVSGDSRITVNSATGALTLRRGMGKGTYKVKIRVRAAGNRFYKAAKKDVTVKIKIK